MKPRGLFMVGIVLEIISTLSGTAGKQLIRLSELTKKRAPGFSGMLFYIGLVINTIAGPILDMAAYSFAPQSLVAPFGGLDVIWNAALAPYILKEQLTHARICSCAFIFVGTLGSGLFGSHSDDDYTIELLQEKLVTIRVPAYLALVALFVVANILGPMRRPKKDIWRGVSLGVTAGAIAGNMFCVKASVELIETSIWKGDREIWTHWLPYGTLLGAAFFAGSNVIFMTRGLLEFEALFMVTIYEGSMIVSNCISASVVLLELEGLEWWRVCMYTICVMTVIVGMVQICWSEVEKRKMPAMAPEILGAQEKEEVSDESEAGFVDQSDLEAPMAASKASAASPTTASTESRRAIDSSGKAGGSPVSAESGSKEADVNAVVVAVA
eukprot:TRINITY_DN30856_c0_g2_i1.p1 TRINITY_DN30856_c0_g2~~TRINITY_DN30856_c0_g2_i1.p1  ORF type:complete len:383 (-),score=88.81 TRINITY_DN30856_c0_g2_i1:97-1245(-)